MKNYIIIITSLFLLSCEMFEEQNSYVQPELAKQFETYEIEAKIRGINWNPTNANYTVKITQDLITKHGTSGIVGLATKSRNGKHITIQIDKNHFDMWNNDEWSFLIEYAIIHEAGHGFLNYKHKDFQEGDIMHPKTNKGLYHSNQTEMLNEFFQAEPIY